MTQPLIGVSMEVTPLDACHSLLRLAHEPRTLPRRQIDWRFGASDEITHDHAPTSLARHFLLSGNLRKQIAQRRRGVRPATPVAYDPPRLRDLAQSMAPLRRRGHLEKRK